MLPDGCRTSSSSDALDVVYLGADGLLKGLFQRSQAIALQLTRSSRVLYANLDSCSVLHYVFDRLFRRTIPHPLDPCLIRPNLWTVDFITPVPHLMFRANNTMNLRAIAKQLRRAIQMLNFKDYVLWVGSPLMASMIKHIPASKTCYDCMDDFPGFFRGRARRRAAKLENWLLRSCDLAIATSDLLVEKAQRFNSNVHLVRNAVGIEHYSEQESTCPPDLRSLPRPILGYVGYVGPWFDMELFKKLARGYPQGSLVIVGPVQISARGFSRLPNVHVVGQKAYREMPQYIRAFDVCLIPFQINDLTRAVNPVKFYEYCAAGKPTVSVRLPELEPYRSLCYLADSREEFITAVGEALREVEDPERAADLARRRRRFAEENSWDVRGQEIESILRSECQTQYAATEAAK